MLKPFFRPIFAPNEQAKIFLRHQGFVSSVPQTLGILSWWLCGGAKHAYYLEQGFMLGMARRPYCPCPQYTNGPSRHGMLKAVGQGGDASRKELFGMGGG